MNAKFAQIRAETMKLNREVGLGAPLTPVAIPVGAGAALIIFLSLSPGLYAAEVLEGVEIERPGAAAPLAAEPEPRAVPAKPDRTVIGPGVHPNRVIVKFVEGSAVRLRTGNLASLGPPGAKAAMAPLSDLISSFPGTKIERQFTRPEQDLEKEKVQGEARSGKKLADLNNYYVITLKEDADTGAFIDALNAMDIVEIAYPEPIPEPAAVEPPHVPSDIPPVTPSLSGGQGYLNAAPTGVDASFAWTKAGGRGAGIKIADIEGGWQIGHEDLDIHATDLLSGTNSADPGWRNHGTAVLGEIIGHTNGYGITGIAGQAKARMVSIFGNTTANAINIAASNLSRGDIILIELHAPGPDSGAACECNCDQFEYIAMEFWQDNFDAIQAATANGIIVVEAAGNGSMNLDNAVYGGNFDRSVRDSGAILIGAATSSVPHNPTCWTNFGNRIDSYGWGENVSTTGYGDLFDGGGDANQYYTSSFSGTSSASPIVVGAAASLQGYVRAKIGRGRLTPRSMRHILTGTGTGQGFGGSWGFKHIGTLPDLKKAINHLSGKVEFDIVSAPSVFFSTTALRDTFATFGAKFRGPGTSPDGGAVLNEGSNFSVSGYSAPNFLAFNCGATLSNGAIPQFPERVIFSKPPLSKVPERVTLRAGSGLSTGETVTFTAQGSSGNVLDTATLNLASGLESVDLLGPGIKTVNMEGPAACAAVVDDVYFGGCMTQKYTDNFGTEYYVVQDGSNISGRTHNGSVDGNPWIIRGNRSGSSLTFRVTNPSLDTGCFSYTFTGTVGAGCGTATGTWVNNDGICSGSGSMTLNATGITAPISAPIATSPQPMSGGL